MWEITKMAGKPRGDQRSMRQLGGKNRRTVARK